MKNRNTDAKSKVQILGYVDKARLIDKKPHSIEFESDSKLNKAKALNLKNCLSTANM